MKKHLRAYAVRTDKDGPIPFLASSPDRVRDGMAIPADAWDTTNFARSPVLLWSHDWMGNRPPIGRVINLKSTERGLVGEADFDHADSFAAEISRKMRAGYVSAFSVGFDIKEMDADRLTVRKAELLEISVVPVGADPKALADARAAFRSLASNTDTDRDFLEELHAAAVPNPEAEALARLAAMGLKPLSRRERRTLDELTAYW